MSDEGDDLDCRTSAGLNGVAPRQRATPGTGRQTSAPPEFLLDLDQRSNDLIDTELTFCAGRAQGRPMKDYQMHLEKLCADAAECVLISDQATNPEKQHRLQGSSSTREKFTRRFDADSPDELGHDLQLQPATHLGCVAGFDRSGARSRQLG
jgi:hypothetical protein